MASRAAVRAAVADMLEGKGTNRRTVVSQMLRDVLDWGDHLRMDHEIPAALAEPVPDHGLTLTADFGFYAEDSTDELADESAREADTDETDDTDEDGDSEEPGPAQGPWRLLGMLTPWETHPLTRTTENGWTASPVERLAHLLRARDVPIGLVTDGRWWALVWAPVGGSMGAAVWDASLWSEEPETLQAFVVLLTRARFLAVGTQDTLPQLLTESLGAQEEVTVTLGRQVRDAVELLITTLDRLDADSEGQLLAGVDDDTLYDGVVTVMMRVVFLLFAEERRLLPSDDHVYITGYSVARLVEQLDEQKELAGEQSLEHRTGAWHRLLAIARALHRGVAHEDLRLPAYGGGLFDPDRYPWLEGRSPADGSDAVPPAIDDRTVWLMLRAVQYVNIGGERRRLTFRALDVEQIGYVYEGLLELEVRTAAETMLCLERAKKWPKAKHPSEVSLSAASAAGSSGSPELIEWLAGRTGYGKTQLATLLGSPVKPEHHAGLLLVTGADTRLVKAIEPFAAVLRYDERDLPVVVMPGRRYIAPSTRRTVTGTHYTPRSLAEDVANNTLEPLVYRPGPLETADRKGWRIRPSNELLDLRVADIAMGSGAFLVASCRYLADRLVDAWVEEGKQEALIAERKRTAPSTSDTEVDQIALDARRLVAEHCLYGVDINPLAVEMAKLSLWLVTMDRERPFGFLDDRLVTGDSLLGLASLDQLETLHVNPPDGRRLHRGAFDFSAQWRPLLAEAADLRRRITAAPVVTMRDVEHKQRLLAEAQQLARSLDSVASAVTATGVRYAAARARETDGAFVALQVRVANALPDDAEKLLSEAEQELQSGRPQGVEPRRPQHWPLTFPEVFVDAADTGFDAVVGNPPFAGGQKLSGLLGQDYLAWLQRWDGHGVKGSADLAARFVLRAERLLSRRGQLGYITTNTLVQGATLQVGLGQVAERGLQLRRGTSSHPWPSASANLEIVEIWATRTPPGPGGVRCLDGEDVPSIGVDLEPVGRVTGRPVRLSENEGIAFQGSIVLGLGFTLTREQAAELIARDPRNAEILQPYVIGKDLNQRPDCSASRWIINFRDWDEERARSYPDAFAIVERLVKPDRQRHGFAGWRRKSATFYWQYEGRRTELYETIASANNVLAMALVGNAVMPVRVPTGQVFSHKTAVFALEDYASMAVLSSSIHVLWVIRYTSTMRTDINYSPSDVFLTFPLPDVTSELETLGRRLDTERRNLMLDRGWGLTTTYIRHVHNPADRDPEVQALRDLHTEIDHAVLAAYGWSGLDPQMGHHPTKIGTRWTFSKDARFQLLDCLLEENHRRHEAEQ
ncbi:hypothetical protein BG844_30280 [Couchioplanes caeruleus subsp. caeruleus]|uniref:site-specific DNA-methyltransferase (adenine-specific) n=1 Tax=Couchioplanes caeruleus subsp. caeruleus TaxID=56427 RepID=A0A1K0FDD2_9ACTN|nr:hypothetical protein BG844_30280 [Couchioplanes caeruleus subsp. caeruleus]